MRLLTKAVLKVKIIRRGRLLAGPRSIAAIKGVYMKYLVFSDSHGRVSELEKALFSEQYDAVIFLGDGVQDITEAMNWFPGKGLVEVKGNCDAFTFSVPTERTVLSDGCNVFLCHGHTQNVKFGLYHLLSTARDRKAGAVLYGHTHVKDLHEEDGILVLNPGSIGFNGEYATLTLLNGKITAELKSTAKMP